MTRGGRWSGGPDRRDLLFRAAAFLAGVVPLGLVIVVVVRNPFAGVVALVAGMIGGLALVFAVPEGAGGAPAGNRHTLSRQQSAGLPPSASAAQDPALTASYPAHSAVLQRAGDGPAGGQWARAARSPVGGGTAVVERTHSASEGGYVLGQGSRAGQAAWRLPLSSGQPGIAVDAARVGDLEVRAASVIGPAHRCEEPAVARQDAYVLARDRRSEHLVVAVADGLSASAHSELGARVAVSTAARELTAALDRLRDPLAVDVDALFRTVAGEMAGTGRGRGLAEQDLCCVLVVAAIPTATEADGSRRVWTAQIGDVSVWTHGPEWVQRTGHAKSGLDLGRNELKDVLPFHPGKAVCETIRVPPGYGVAVLTDGVGDLLNDVRDAVGFLAERWAAPPNPAEFLATLCLDAPGQDDDRTAVVVWCGAGAPTTRALR